VFKYTVNYLRWVLDGGSQGRRASSGWGRRGRQGQWGGGEHIHLLRRVWCERRLETGSGVAREGRCQTTTLTGCTADMQQACSG
jgi:hypothetical protein